MIPRLMQWSKRLLQIVWWWWWLFLYRILVSTAPAVLCYFMIWVVPPIEKGKMMWYLVFYCLFQTLQTVSTHTRTPTENSNYIYILWCWIFTCLHMHYQLKVWTLLNERMFLVIIKIFLNINRFKSLKLVKKTYLKFTYALISIQIKNVFEFKLNKFKTDEASRMALHAVLYFWSLELTICVI